MRKCLVAICLLSSTLFYSQKGIWKNGVYRAKKEKYSIVKEPFYVSEKVIFNRMYLSSNEEVFNSSNPGVLNKITSGIGFYGDGRFIINGYNFESRYIENERKNRWELAQEVGYYRIKGEKIKVEFLSSGNFGRYVKWEGIIRGDTIIFYKNIYYPIRKEVREERYILSDLSFE